MKIGEAIEYARNGRKISREGWNGKGMYVYVTPERTVATEDWVALTPAHEVTEAERARGHVIVGDHLDMMSAQGVRIIGWLASQSDMLAEDWYVVEQKDKCTPEEDELKMRRDIVL